MFNKLILSAENSSEGGSTPSENIDFVFNPNNAIDFHQDEALMNHVNNNWPMQAQEAINIENYYDNEYSTTLQLSIEKAINNFIAKHNNIIQNETATYIKALENTDTIDKLLKEDIINSDTPEEEENRNEGLINSGNNPYQKLLNGEVSVSSESVPITTKIMPREAASIHFYQKEDAILQKLKELNFNSILSTSQNEDVTRTYLDYIILSKGVSSAEASTIMSQIEFGAYDGDPREDNTRYLEGNCSNWGKKIIDEHTKELTEAKEAISSFIPLLHIFDNFYEAEALLSSSNENLRLSNNQFTLMNKNILLASDDSGAIKISPTKVTARSYTRALMSPKNSSGKNEILNTFSMPSSKQTITFSFNALTEDKDVTISYNYTAHSGSITDNQGTFSASKYYNKSNNMGTRTFIAHLKSGQTMYKLYISYHGGKSESAVKVTK